MWKIHIGDKVLPAVYADTKRAVQSFMESLLNSGGGDPIKEEGVFVVHSETFESYQMAYQGQDNNRSYVYATCGGGIVLDYQETMQARLKAESREEAEMLTWLNERERWASASPNFAKGGEYRDHQVVFYDAKIGWIHAKPGNGLKEAVRNAMNTRINYETQEYFDPAE
jgi:hypothetical protein